MGSARSREQTLAAVSASPLPGRRLASWLDCWCDNTVGTGSPLLLRRWCGISLLASVLERKTWLVTSKGRLFPNLYLFMVAPPGIGKTLMLNIARGLLDELGTDGNRIHTAASNISAAALADALNSATRKIDRVREDPINPFVTYNSLSIFVAELGNFLPEYDPRMINTLTDLYDCGGYKEQKRGNDLKIDIPDAQLNLLGACTPSYLNSFIPPGAWDQGFMSRVIMAYSGETVLQPIFGDNDRVELPDDLRGDLQSIFELYGEFAMHQDYKDAFNSWQREGLGPLPTHPRLLHYNTRRLAHVLKLSMIACINRTSSMLLEACDFEQARDWLVEAEVDMPEIFKASGLSGDSAIMDDCFHFVFRWHQKEKAPMAEARVLDFLRRRIAGPQVFTILKVMEASRMLERVSLEGHDRPFYKPVPAQEHQ